MRGVHYIWSIADVVSIGIHEKRQTSRAISVRKQVLRREMRLQIGGQIHHEVRTRFHHKYKIGRKAILASHRGNMWP